MISWTHVNLVVWSLASLHILYTWLIAFYHGRRARAREIPHFSLATTPLVSVLIPAWNECAVLENTLQALQRSTYPKWEAIIIAGGSDGTEALARRLCARRSNFLVISQLPRGKNAALNQGFLHARGDYIVLLDADIVIEPEWLSCLIAPLTQGYFASTSNYFPSRWTLISAYYEIQKIAGYQVGGSTSLHGHGIALQREVVEHIGGFPEEVTVGVDWDLDQRVERLGFSKIFVPKARHRAQMAYSLGKYLRDEIRWRRAHLRAVFRFFSLRSIFALSFYFITLAFFIAPLVLISPYPCVSFLLCFYLWVLLRRLGLAIEVATFSADKYWLKYAGMLPIMLVVDFLTALIALTTLWKKQTFFKGPRPGS